MGIQDIRDSVSSLFVMLNKETFVLFRIEFLVVLVTLLFLVMFIIDVFRRHIRNTMMTALFSTLDAVSDSIVIYLLGAMQTAKFKNQLFPVWALVLVSFRYNVDFISGYGVHDRHGRRFMEWRNVVKLLGSAFLNLSRGSRFAHPLWSLWALQILRSGYRFYAHSLALCSVWHGKSSEVVAEHMRAGPHTSNWKPEDCEPENMEGYKYLIQGESKRSIKFKKPRYVMYIDTAQNVQQAKRGSCPCQVRSSLVTLEKIWGCRRHLLHPDNTKGNEPKDLSLAFALSRLLRCRLEDVTLQEDIFSINRKLVKTKILEEQNTDRAFRVMELQLSFVNDYFNTRYPMVFWHGFLSLFSNLLLSAVTFGVVCWLAVDIRKVYKPPKNDRAHVVNGVNVDMIITWAFMFFMLFKEIWEMVSYLVSDWTRLLLLCSYAQWKEEDTRNKCMEGTISSFFKSRITTKQWHGLIDQYVFLESYADRPRFWNLMNKITTGMVPKKDNGATLGCAINVPECVKPAILKKLCASLEKLSNLDTVHQQPDNPNRNHEDPSTNSGRFLPKVITSLSDAAGNRRKRYGWACFSLPTCSHIILVWHIATSLCEMKLARRHGVDLSKPGFLGSLLSCFTGWCSSKPYLMDVDEKTKEKKKVNEKLPDKLEKMYITANSLSRYCAYLLVSKPDLVPDSFHVPKMVFEETVTRARDNILKNCDSLQSRYDKLMTEAKNAIQDVDDVMKKEDILRLGAMLGKELIDQETEEECWEILSGVWADLLVHIAPTWNAEAHKQCLESGGEFVTYIWALLWHCGIEKSELWPVEDVYGKDTPGTPPDNCVPNNKTQLAQEMQQTCAGPREEREEADIQKSEMQKVDPQERNGWIDMEQINENIRKPSAKPNLELGEATGVAANEHYQDMLTTNMIHRDGQGNVVRGMKNGGNTCYFNAVLQSLLALDKLHARMLGPDLLTGDLGQELQKLFIMTSYTNGAGGVLMTEKLFSHMCSRNSDFRPGVMEDSNYMLVSLLDGLNNEEPTMVEPLFRGKVVKHVSSKECEHTSVTTEDLHLSLAIPSKKSASIEDCLDLYVTGVIETWRCTYCSAAAAAASSAAGNGSLNQEDTAVNDGQPEQSDNKTHRKEENAAPAAAAAGNGSLNQEDTPAAAAAAGNGSLNQEDTPAAAAAGNGSLDQEDAAVDDGQPEQLDNKTHGKEEDTASAAAGNGYLNEKDTAVNDGQPEQADNKTHRKEKDTAAAAGNGYLNQEDTAVNDGQPEQLDNKTHRKEEDTAAAAAAGSGSLNQEDTTVNDGQPEHSDNRTHGKEEGKAAAAAGNGSLNQQNTADNDGQHEQSDNKTHGKEEDLNQEGTADNDGQPEQSDNKTHIKGVDKAAAAGNGSLNQDDMVDNDGQPEQSDNKTHRKGEDKAAAAGNGSLNQEDMAANDRQPEQSHIKTHGKEESSHPVDRQTRNQNNGKPSVLDDNADQMEQSQEDEKIYRSATVKYRISKAAPILTIQLKRFNYSHTDKAQKLEERVSFQDKLDITKFMDPGQVENEEYNYCLVAVIVHSGPRLREGHFFAYVRASQTGGQQQESGGTPSWFRVSDEIVTPVSLEQVLECQAYILFYERVEQAEAEPIPEDHLPTDD